MITRASYPYKLIRFSRQDCVGDISHRLWALLAASAFFLCADRRKFDRPFFPGFLSGLGLRAAYQLEQTNRAPTKIDIVARGKFFWLSQKTVRVHGIENELPLEILLAGQHK